MLRRRAAVRRWQVPQLAGGRRVQPSSARVLDRRLDSRSRHYPDTTPTLRHSDTPTLRHSVRSVRPVSSHLDSGPPRPVSRQNRHSCTRHLRHPRHSDTPTLQASMLTRGTRTQELPAQDTLWCYYPLTILSKGLPHQGKHCASLSELGAERAGRAEQLGEPSELGELSELSQLGLQLSSAAHSIPRLSTGSRSEVTAAAFPATGSPPPRHCCAALVWRGRCVFFENGSFTRTLSQFPTWSKSGGTRASLGSSGSPRQIKQAAR